MIGRGRTILRIEGNQDSAHKLLNSYDLENSAFVQFKKTRIKVFEANNSSIAFEVVADDS